MRITVTIEIALSQALDWQPAGTATLDGKEMRVVPEGTTRPGLTPAGSLVRLVVFPLSDRALEARRLEIACGDTTLVVALTAD